MKLFLWRFAPVGVRAKALPGEASTMPWFSTDHPRDTFSFRSPQNFAYCQAKRNEIRPNFSFRFVSFRFVQNIWYRISFRFVFTGSPQAELGALYINKASKMIDFSRGCPRASASNLWSHFVSFRFVLRQAPGAALPFRFVSFRFGRKRMFRFISSWKRRASSGHLAGHDHG